MKEIDSGILTNPHVLTSAAVRKRVFFFSLFYCDFFFYTFFSTCSFYLVWPCLFFVVAKLFRQWSLYCELKKQFCERTKCSCTVNETKCCSEGNGSLATHQNSIFKFADVLAIKYTEKKVLLRQQNKGQQIIFLLLQPKLLLQQPNVLLIELNILLLY